MEEKDDEKYEKIRSQGQQKRMKLYYAFVALVCLALMYLLKKEHSPKNNQANLRQTPALVRRSVDELEVIYEDLDRRVREIKRTGVIMETDPESMRVTKQLQVATTDLLEARYGKHSKFRIQVDLEFPPTIPDYSIKGKDGSFVIELAPIHLIPVSVFTFLEIARTWKSGMFHRNAGHVLQATANSEAITKHLPFQEYSSQFPHVTGTTGYCGRPSGPCWYVSIQDNTKNHGPGSQQNRNPYEADANFGKVVEGMDTVKRIHSTKARGWLNQKDQIKIMKMTIMVPDDSNGNYILWTPIK